MNVLKLAGVLVRALSGVFLERVFFFKEFLIFVCVYSYVFVGMCTHVYRYVEQSEKGIGSSGAGVTSCSESPNMIIGNQTQVFGKSDCSDPLSYLSSPCSV